MTSFSTSFDTNNSNAETKFEGNGERCTDADVDADFELRQSYQDAVECLIQFDSIISSLQAQLVVKDEQIVGLEERVVQMSLEMASLKAFEDEHRGRRRVTSPGISDESIAILAGEKNGSHKNSSRTTTRRNPPARRHRSLSRLGSGRGRGTPSNDNPASDRSLKTSRRCTTPGRNRSSSCLGSSWVEDVPTKVTSTTDHRSSDHTLKTCSFTSASSMSSNCVDESSAGRLSVDIGQFFRKSFNKIDWKDDCDDNVDEMQHETATKTPSKSSFSKNDWLYCEYDDELVPTPTRIGGPNEARRELRRRKSSQ